jgi:hypothetical protein
VLVNGFFWATCGSGYIDGAYRYHFLKPVQAGAGLADEIGQVLFHNFFLVAAPVYLAPAAAFLIFRSLLDDASRGDWRRYFDPSREPVLAAAIWTTALWAGNLLFLSRLGQVFDYYFLLLFPPAAVAGGLLAATLWTAVRAAPRSRAALAGGVFLITLVCVGLLIYPRFERGLGYYAANAGKTKTYSFPHSPLPEALQWPVRAPFWSPDRTVGRRYTGILFYLWHESREFDTAREIAAVLRENARPGETIFGDSTSTPLVALLAGVPITDRFPDTNSMRFECGLPAPAAAARQLEAALERDNDRLAWVLLIPGRGIASRKPAVPGKRREWRFSELMDFFGERFQPFRSFPTAEWGTYQLWRRRDVPLPAGAPGGGRGGAGGVESGGGEVEPAAPEEN